MKAQENKVHSLISALLQNRDVCDLQRWCEGKQPVFVLVILLTLFKYGITPL